MLFFRKKSVNEVTFLDYNFVCLKEHIREVSHALRV